MLNFKLKKIIDAFDSTIKIASLIGIAATGLIIILIKVFDIKVSTYLEKIPFIHAIVNMDLIAAFEGIDEDDMFYVELQNSIKDFMEDSENIQNIEVKQDGENQKIFKITMKDGEERFITVTKDGEEFNLNMNLFERLLLKKDANGLYLIDLDSGLKRAILDDNYCLRCSGGRGTISSLNNDTNTSADNNTNTNTNTSTDTSPQTVTETIIPTQDEVQEDTIDRVPSGGGGGGTTEIQEHTGYDTEEYISDQDYMYDTYGY